MKATRSSHSPATAGAGGAIVGAWLVSEARSAATTASPTCAASPGCNWNGSTAIEFSVADTGSGIPPEVQGRVFDWFQTHSRGSGHRGAGLGLSIVRSFVELHGGTVTLRSAVGEGTTVVCRFPLEQHAERTAA